MSNITKRAAESGSAEPRTFKLTKPITREDGSTLTELRLRPQESMTLGDLLAIERNMRAPNDLERSTAMAMRLSGLDREEIEHLSIEDAGELFQFMGGGDPKASTPTETS